MGGGGLGVGRWRECRSDSPDHFRMTCFRGINPWHCQTPGTGGATSVARKCLEEMWVAMGGHMLREGDSRGMDKRFSSAHPALGLGIELSSADKFSHFRSGAAKSFLGVLCESGI